MFPLQEPTNWGVPHQNSLLDDMNESVGQEMHNLSPAPTSEDILQPVPASSPIITAPPTNIALLLSPTVPPAQTLVTNITSLPSLVMSPAQTSATSVLSSPSTDTSSPLAPLPVQTSISVPLIISAAQTSSTNLATTTVLLSPSPLAPLPVQTLTIVIQPIAEGKENEGYGKNTQADTNARKKTKHVASDPTDVIATRKPGHVINKPKHFIEEGSEVVANQVGSTKKKKLS
ncbi:hypothetical protein PQX77_014679 [Marasmius sp. AFHP31]|nr:hypothetical protein PQX77_014679 [Marasmius sp. AFHP31]